VATFKVDNLVFSFQRNISASKYDESDHHRQVLMPTGKKAVDLVAVRRTALPPDCWLVEAKDFRLIRGTPGDKNVADLPATVASKAADTWDGLRDAASQATNAGEKQLASLARTAARVRVVLHLEPYTGGPSKLFPKNPSPASIQQKLKQLVRDLDPRPLVLTMATTAKSEVPWTVS
jgi:hypothetical protein